MGMGTDIKTLATGIEVTCPHCGSVLEIKLEPTWGPPIPAICTVCGAEAYEESGYKATVIRVIHEEPETFTTETVTCPSCGATLELTKSSYFKNNVEQYCPECGASAC